VRCAGWADAASARKGQPEAARSSQPGFGSHSSSVFCSHGGSTHNRRHVSYPRNPRKQPNRPSAHTTINHDQSPNLISVSLLESVAIGHQAGCGQSPTHVAASLAAGLCCWKPANCKMGCCNEPVESRDRPREFWLRGSDKLYRFGFELLTWLLACFLAGKEPPHSPKVQARDTVRGGPRQQPKRKSLAMAAGFVKG